MTTKPQAFKPHDKANGAVLENALAKKTVTPQGIRYYLSSCGLLLVPALVWNVALASYLPAAFAPSEFWRDIPAPLGFVENLFRTLVFVLPFLMPLDLSTPTSRRALLWFAFGTLIYFGSWLALMVSPASSWATSALGFMAPAYTPALWLIGIAMLGQKLFWGRSYRWWMYLLVAAPFLTAHIWHTALVYSRIH
jgi:hypothetical protein